MIDDVAELVRAGPRTPLRRRSQCRDRRSHVVSRHRREGRSRCRRARSRSSGSPRHGPMPHNGYRPFDPAATCNAFPGFPLYPARRGLGRAAQTAGVRLMAEVDLLRALPKTKRNIQKRAEAKDPAVIAHRQAIWRDVFRRPARIRLWRLSLRRPLASGGARHHRAFRLEAGMRVLDVGCAKGFLVKDLLRGMPGPGGLRPRHLALRADALRAGGRRPAASRQRRRAAVSRRLFDCVLSLNTIHNLPAAARDHRDAGDPAPGERRAPSCRSTPIARPSRRRSSKAGC